ncbi:MAG: hypothetical protein V1887_02100 [Candidatus Aenigmatarchaeota archaeon]
MHASLSDGLPTVVPQWFESLHVLVWVPPTHRDHAPQYQFGVQWVTCAQPLVSSGLPVFVPQEFSSTHVLVWTPETEHALHAPHCQSGVHTAGVGSGSIGLTINCMTNTNASAMSIRDNIRMTAFLLPNFSTTEMVIIA